MEKHYGRIKEHFGNRQFSIEGLAKALGIKASSAYWIIREMIKAGRAIRIMRGAYKLADAKEAIPQKEVERMRRHFISILTRRFAFTGLSILEQFIHHMPYALIYHLFVEPGSSEEFKHEIKAPHDTAVLINPALNEIEVMLNNTKIRKMIVIRENNYFYSSKKGLASIESAFVDLFFEVTRGKIPFIKTDLEEIFKSLALNSMVNYSRLLKYAKIRGIKGEIKPFLRHISESVEIPKEALK
ncbi:MAG: DUF6577 family protein [Nanoarchaeota archaeon]